MRSPCRRPRRPSWFPATMATTAALQATGVASGAARATTTRPAAAAAPFRAGKPLPTFSGFSKVQNAEVRSPHCVVHSALRSPGTTPRRTLPLPRCCRAWPASRAWPAAPSAAAASPCWSRPWLVSGSSRGAGLLALLLPPFVQPRSHNQPTMWLDPRAWPGRAPHEGNRCRRLLPPVPAASTRTHCAAHPAHLIHPYCRRQAPDAPEHVPQHRYHGPH